MVQMGGVDLQQFQFDYDLTWAALFLRHDGTVYARYGSRDGTGSMSHNSVEGLKLTMQRVLAAHKLYPENKQQFASKRGPAQKYKRPEQMPAPTIERVKGKATSAENCLHCHNIYDAQHELLVAEGHYDPNQLWKYPQPDNLGFAVDQLSGTRVTEIKDQSPAGQAGLRIGDTIERANGQAILSVADLQFVLHHLPLGQPLRLTVRTDERGDDAGTTREILLPLSEAKFADWKRQSIAWRVSMYGMPPKPGLWIAPLKANKRGELGRSEQLLGLEVRGLFGDAVRRSELKKGDVIVAVDGLTESMTPAQFHERLRLTHYRPGSVMKLVVIRDGQRRSIEVEF